MKHISGSSISDIAKEFKSWEISFLLWFRVRDRERKPSGSLIGAEIIFCALDSLQYSHSKLTGSVY